MKKKYPFLQGVTKPDILNLSAEDPLVARYIRAYDAGVITWEEALMEVVVMLSVDRRAIIDRAFVVDDELFGA